MGYRVSGILKLPDGTPANNAEIEFISRKNFSPLVQELKSNIKCSATGAYDVTLEYGEYAVVVYPGGTYPAALGTIILAADTATGQDLPTLLQQAGWQPATPEYITQINTWLAQANASADRANNEASRATTQADRAKSEADRAAQITGINTVIDAIALAALPLPDVWAPLSDSLRLITGYGRDVLVGSDVVARMVNFSRSTAATYIGKDGQLKTAATNEPRFERNGLLIEGQSTNLIPTSSTLTTQTLNVQAGTHTISFYGTGSVSLSGSATGVIAGNGANNRATLTFTATTGSLTLTVTGACINGQLEALPFASSYIPTNGAAVTRAADIVSITPVGNFVKDGTWSFEVVNARATPASSGGRIFWGQGGANAIYGVRIFFDTSELTFFGGTTEAKTIIATGVSAVTGVVAFSLGRDCRFGQYLKSIPALGGDINLTSINIGSDASGLNNCFCHVRNLRGYLRSLSDTQLKAIV